MRLLFLLLLLVIISSGVIYFVLKNQAQVSTSKSTTQSLEEEFGKEIAVSSGNWIEQKDAPIFDNEQVSTQPKKYEDNKLAKILGVNTSDKWLEVNLTEQKIYAWEGNQKVFEFFVSTGRPGYDTPTGEFTVWRKVLYQAYKGGSKDRGDYYYLPNVPYSLFFANNKIAKGKGYAVHGAYWHNDFGIKRRSSGCVNVRPEEAAKLYYWANPLIGEGVNAINSTADNPGIRVSIHY